MSKVHWALAINGNPGLAEWDIGPHFYFWHDRNDGGNITPLFSSPHVNVLQEEESTRAYIRIKTLLRLLSGINILRGDDIFYHHSTLEYVKDNLFRTGTWTEDIDVTIEELGNPFDENILNDIQLNRIRRGSEEPSLVKDYIELSVNESLVREVLLLLTLGEEETIYFLINTYKIFENIRNDLGLKVSNRKIHGRKDLPSELLESLSKLAGYSQYINSKDASGILSRHGSGNTPSPKDKPSLIEIKRALRLAVSTWMKYKCEISFGRVYKPTH